MDALLVADEIRHACERRRASEKIARPAGIIRLSAAWSLAKGSMGCKFSVVVERLGVSIHGLMKLDKD
jgi:hypothetical protein